MKNLTDLPEGTPDEIREKLHCYFSEKYRIESFMALLAARNAEIDKIVKKLIDKSADEVMKRHKIKAVRLSLD